jgi:hypothetical protein
MIWIEYSNLVLCEHLSRHRLHSWHFYQIFNSAQSDFKYGYQAAILENQLRLVRAITPELMAGSAPNFNHRYTSIYWVWGYFTVSSQEVTTMALAISFWLCWVNDWTLSGCRGRPAGAEHCIIILHQWPWHGRQSFDVNGFGELK